MENRKQKRVLFSERSNGWSFSPLPKGPKNRQILIKGATVKRKSVAYLGEEENSELSSQTGKKEKRVWGKEVLPLLNNSCSREQVDDAISTPSLNTPPAYSLPSPNPFLLHTLTQANPTNRDPLWVSDEPAAKLNRQSFIYYRIFTNLKKYQQRNRNHTPGLGFLYPIILYGKEETKDVITTRIMKNCFERTNYFTEN